MNLVFFFAPALLTPHGQEVRQPDFVERVAWHSGKLRELKAVEPADFAQSSPTDQPLGILTLPSDMTAEQFVALRSQLFALYDVLVPMFAARDARYARAAAREFRSIFPRLREPPLAPYYTALGREFFAWVETSAQ